MKGVFLMNLKKFLKAALCGAMVVAMAVTAGCGGGDKKADSGKKVLKVGMECAYAPYNWSQPSADALPICLIKSCTTMIFFPSSFI